MALLIDQYTWDKLLPSKDRVHQYMRGVWNKIGVFEDDRAKKSELIANNILPEEYARDPFWKLAIALIELDAEYANPEYALGSFADPSVLFDDDIMLWFTNWNLESADWFRPSLTVTVQFSRIAATVKSNWHGNLSATAVGSLSETYSVNRSIAAVIANAWSKWIRLLIKAINEKQFILLGLDPSSGEYTHETP